MDTISPKTDWPRLQNTMPFSWERLVHLVRHFRKDSPQDSNKLTVLVISRRARSYFAMGSASSYSKEIKNNTTLMHPIGRTQILIGSSSTSLSIYVRYISCPELRRHSEIAKMETSKTVKVSMPDKVGYHTEARRMQLHPKLRSSPVSGLSGVCDSRSRPHVRTAEND